MTHEDWIAKSLLFEVWCDVEEHYPELMVTFDWETYLQELL